MPQRTSFTQSEYDRRHNCILSHTGRHRLLLAACITRTFGLGKALPHVYTRLVSQGLLQGFTRVLPGGGSCYVLTANGCKAVNAPVGRAQMPEGPALDLSIAVSVFCHLGKSRRWRAEHDEVSTLLGTPMPNNLAYVVTNELGGQATLLRCVLAATLSAQEAVRTVRMMVDQARRNSVLQPWVDSKQYGFAVLAATLQTLSAIEKAISKSGIRQTVAVVVGLGPTAETLSAALKAKGN